MPKVSVKLGLTLPGPEQYSSFRADFGISEIDTEGDVEQQLKDALAAGDRAAVVAEAGLAQQASNVSGITLEGVGVGQAFGEFRKKFQPLWKALVERVSALEEPNVKRAIEADEDEEEEAAEQKPKPVSRRTSGKRK